MKFLRCGAKGKEKPAVLDKNDKIRDLSSYISDLNPENINFKILEKLKKVAKKQILLLQIYLILEQ